MGAIRADLVFGLKLDNKDLQDEFGESFDNLYNTVEHLWNIYKPDGKAFEDSEFLLYEAKFDDWEYGNAVLGWERSEMHSFGEPISVPTLQFGVAIVPVMVTLNEFAEAIGMVRENSISWWLVPSASST